MKIVIAPDSFKGSASSIEIAQWIENGITSVIPDCETVKIAIGDGGEGSLDAVLSAGFTAHSVDVLGPLGNPVTAKIAIRGETAFIEMAQASGLSQLPGGRMDALHASSFGTGQLMLAALDKGAEKMILAIGGSATTDAGVGALQALGARLMDNLGNEIAPGGAALNSCVSIDTLGLDPRLAKVSFTLASDVTNPLLGELGAARIFSPQKGATLEEVKVLEQSLAHFASLVGGEFASAPGAGAAGGFGFMAYAFLNATAESGIDLILDIVGFDSHLADADFVITGEGKFDAQSLQGKAPWGILQHATKKQLPTILVAGQTDVTAAKGLGFHSAFSMSDYENSAQITIANPKPYLVNIGEVLARTLIL